MSATLLRDGTHGDIARSARPYLVTSKGTGFIPLMASFWTFGRGTNHPHTRHHVHIQLPIVAFVQLYTVSTILPLARIQVFGPCCYRWTLIAWSGDYPALQRMPIIVVLSVSVLQHHA